MLGFFASAAVVMTWPLALNLRTAAAHPADPYITSWILDWGYYALTHQPLRWFDANIFHPLRYTFAFSENMLGVVVVMVPLFIARVPLLLLHNIAILAAFATAGYSAALLGRHVTGSTAAGIAGGIFFAFVPWRFTHLTHLQHLWTMWLPLLILSILRLRERPTRARTALFVLCFVMNGLTNLHWLAFGSTAAALCIAVTGVGAGEELRRFRAAAAIGLVAGGLLLVPLLYPYARARQLYGLRGDAGETEQYSARPSDWAIASLHNRVYGPHLNDGSVDPERWSFPGLAGPLLALAGAFSLLRRTPRYAVIGVALVVLGFLGSLGLHTPFGRFLFDYVPLFKGIRVPARWSMIAYLGIAMLCSAGVHALAVRKWVSAAALVLLCLDVRAAPIRWYLSTGHTPVVYEWLRDSGMGGAVVELPMDQNSAYGYQFWSHVHHRPLINGVSGFVPPDYARLVEQWNETPIPDAFLETVKSRGAGIVVVHLDKLGPRATAVRRWLEVETARGALVPATSLEDSAVFAMPSYAGAMPRTRSVPPDGARLAHPVHWEEVSGPLDVYGQAPGAQRVILHFDNHRRHYDAAVQAGSFRRLFATRPDDVAADTDLQVEVIEAGGVRRLLPQVWLRWRRPGEALSTAPLPQTADLGRYLVHPVHEDGMQRPRM